MAGFALDDPISPHTPTRRTLFIPEEPRKQAFSCRREAGPSLAKRWLGSARDAFRLEAAPHARAEATPAGVHAKGWRTEAGRGAPGAFRRCRVSPHWGISRQSPVAGVCGGDPGHRGDGVSKFPIGSRSPWGRGDRPGRGESGTGEVQGGCEGAGMRARRPPEWGVDLPGRASEARVVRRLHRCPCLGGSDPPWGTGRSSSDRRYRGGKEGRTKPAHWVEGGAPVPWRPGRDEELGSASASLSERKVKQRWRTRQIQPSGTT